MNQAPSPLLNLMPVILIFIIFYFLMLRPQKKAQGEHKKMIEGLKKNDEVITSGGIHGTIVNVKDHTVILKVDDNVKVEIQKNAITSMKRKAGE